MRTGWPPRAKRDPGNRTAAIRVPYVARSGFRKLAHDRTHGATFLGTEALRLVSNALTPQLVDEPKNSRRICRELAQILRKSQPAMGSFLRWADELDHLARHPGSPNQPIRRWLRQTIRRWEGERAEAVATAVRLFPPSARVLTISKSEAVLRTLTALHGNSIPVGIVALRSLPGGEGTILAEELRRSGLHVTLAEDNILRSPIRDFDLVLVGADAVLRDGALVHKVGTRVLAEAAAQSEVPFVSITGLSKTVDRSRTPIPLPKIFDRTPARFIQGYWTDDGFLSPTEIAVRISHRRLDTH